jgi:hypothetical protein
VAEVRNLVKVSTGLELDETDTVRILDPQTWHRLTQKSAERTLQMSDRLK